ncbi:MAG: hypothetical protein AUJ92_04930 [Armatimonadetes bacterium CG2_30_59_28]|nr:MAG: hypothetical protein AUJ92_04930 [Armatimonadetes bacterium CG2_30_59_28]PIU62085.1 MAG: hypothetical protein COS85_19415 [Armatimonadetes bacterium CG07_land_8_20_14_0_80_59_28]PIY48935.1 MAG: hypothetical protein COZ05_01790 [Armatimonadetes bacterium CG_4_10_14_3_um_filter_59_10]
MAVECGFVNGSWVKTGARGRLENWGMPSYGSTVAIGEAGKFLPLPESWGEGERWIFIRNEYMF